MAIAPKRRSLMEEMEALVHPGRQYQSQANFLRRGCSGGTPNGHGDRHNDSPPWQQQQQQQQQQQNQHQQQRQGAVAGRSQYSSSAGGYQVVAELCFSPKPKDENQHPPQVPPVTPSNERISDYIQAGYASPESSRVNNLGANDPMNYRLQHTAPHVLSGDTFASPRTARDNVVNAGEWEQCYLVEFDSNLWEWRQRIEMVCLQGREGLDMEGRSVGRCTPGVTLPLRTDWNVFLMQDNMNNPGAPPRSLVITSRRSVHSRLASQAERSATTIFFADEFNTTFQPQYPVVFQGFVAVQLAHRQGTPLGYAMDLLQEEELDAGEVKARREHMRVFEMFTFMRSRGCLVITEATMSGRKWKQPILHSLHKEYGEMDRGQEGIAEFAVKHKLFAEIHDSVPTGHTVGHRL